MNFGGSLAGGGYTGAADGMADGSGGIAVYVLGQAIPLLLEVRINSPDIDGDGHVWLSDVGVFAADLNGTYNFRSDLAGR